MVIYPEWYSKIDNGGIYKIYRTVKTSFHRSHYIHVLNNYCATAIGRFLTTNNNLPVNTDRYKEVDRADRLCIKCNLKDIGDEFHYVFVAPFLIVKGKNSFPNQYLLNKTQFPLEHL